MLSPELANASGIRLRAPSRSRILGGPNGYNTAGGGGALSLSGAGSDAPVPAAPSSTPNAAWTPDTGGLVLAGGKGINSSNPSSEPVNPRDHYNALMAAANANMRMSEFLHGPLKYEPLPPHGPDIPSMSAYNPTDVSHISVAGAQVIIDNFELNRTGDPVQYGAVRSWYDNNVPYGERLLRYLGRPIAYTDAGPIFPLDQALAPIGPFAAGNALCPDPSKYEYELHGNTAGNQPATLYEKYDANGVFRKHGISKDPSGRYTQKELNGGYLIETQTGPRKEMLKIERDLVERNPGPDNHEPWAGKRLGE